MLTSEGGKIIGKIWDDPPIVVTVSRQDVESNNPRTTVDRLWPLVREPLVHKAFGKLVLKFEGYEGDSRQLWQIPEVRWFVQTVDREFSYWFFVADLSGDTLYTVAACMCRLEERGSETVFNKNDLFNFYAVQFARLSEVFREANLPQADQPARVAELRKYFSSVPAQ
jgi:hypothetical protein